MQFTAKINKLALGILVMTGLFAQASVAFASTSSVTCNAATLNGHTDTTVFPVSVWFEWGTNQNTVANGNGTKTASQTLSANAAFSQPLSGLQENTTYYYRAMAQDRVGPLSGAVVSFTTPTCGGGQGQLPTVTTNSASNVDAASATLNEYVDPMGSNGSRWFEWGTNAGNLSNSTSRINISAPGNGSAYISNLSAHTTYYFRASASNSQGTVYGQVLSFTTTGGTTGQRPIATTNSASGISTSDATLNGYVDPNGSNDTVRWFEWGSGYYGFDNTTAQVNMNNAGNVSVYLPNLAPNTTYRFRVVAQNSQGTSYGSTMTFRTSTGTTGQVPVATTRSATGVDNYSATLNGYVDPNGTSNTSRWFEYGTSQGNLYNSTSRVNIGYAGDASAYIASLSSNRTYYFRVVAQNSQGTTYGQVLSFTTNNGGSGGSQLPTVTTNSASNIDNYSATLNGYVDTNGTNDTTRWFEYGTSQGNLYNSTTRVNINNSGNISAYISNLSTNDTYYFRAVAQNSQGTVYGQVLSFTTNGGGCVGCNNDTQLMVTTKSASSVDNYSAQLNGSVDTVNNGVTATRWFEYSTNSSNLSNQTSRISIGYSGSASAYISNLSSNTTYYFRIVAQDTYGTARGQVLSFTTNGGGGSSNLPLVTTRSANNVFNSAALINGYVDANGSGNTSGWFEWGTNQSLTNATSRTSIGGGSSNIASNLSGLSQNTTYYYRAVAQNDYGTVRGSVLSFTTSNSGNTDTTGAPTAITTLPTQITGTSAMLNSLVLNGGNDVARAWFEWGTTQALARSTDPVSIGSVASARHAQTVYDLSVGTTYYFRVVAENSHGKNYGIIRSFVARNPVVITPRPAPTPKPTTQVKIVERIVEKPVLVHAEGVNSLVMLTITGGSDTIAKGEHRTYHVTWRNDSTQKLTNVILRILVPQSMNFESSDDGTFSKVDGTLTIELNQLNPGQTGETNLVANGGDTLKIGDLVVTTANMVYTDESNVQGDALAYTTQRVVEGGGAVLGASVGVASFPMMLLGWLLLLILVIILIILTMHLYNKIKEGNGSSAE